MTPSKQFGFKVAPAGSKATEEEIRELLSQPERDLAGWKDGITLEMVERLYCVPESSDTMRIQVIKHLCKNGEVGQSVSQSLLIYLLYSLSYVLTCIFISLHTSFMKPADVVEY